MRRRVKLLSTRPHLALGCALALALCACATTPALRQVPATTTTTAPRVAPATTSTSTTSTTATTTPGTVPATTAAADIAALPPGNGADIAIVVDDVGGTDAYLADYLHLGVPLTFAIMPLAAKAVADARAVAASGRPALLHIPLPVAPNPQASGGLAMDATDSDVAAYLDAALIRVPDAVGANNHTGSWGTTSGQLMDRLLRALLARHLFFLDSVTTQRTVAYATALALGMPSRINNVFLDSDESTARPQLLALARLAAAHGTAIGIGHASRPWLLHSLQAVASQLTAKGYRFATIDEVTNGPAGGLDVGVRTRL